MLNDVSTLPACRACGFKIRANAVDVPIVLKDLVAHFAHLTMCGSVWACPVCAPRIREVRAREVETLLARHMDAGGGALFLTLTVPHDRGQRLAPLFEAVAGGWRRLTATGTFKRIRVELGIVGTIRSVETTHGRNSWHPHIHALLLTAQELTAEQITALETIILRLWTISAVRSGLREPTTAHGIDLSPVRSAAQVAEYTAKFEDGGVARSVGRELTRHDTKQARRKGRTPVAILRDFADTGDLADLALWREYETVTKGRSSLRFSPGLKKRYRIEEVSDEEIVQDVIGGEILDVLSKPEWKWVRRHHVQTLILEAAEEPERPNFARIMETIRSAVSEQTEAST